jgi:uncharacterized membrane protein YvlD (DUF360 family)
MSRQVRQGVALFLVSALLLLIVIAVVPGLSATSDASIVLATAFVGVVSAVLRRVLAAVATRVAWLGVVIVGLFAQGAIFYTALSLAPGIDVSGFWPAFWASWLYALLVGGVMWAFDANDDALFLRDVLRQAKRSSSNRADDGPGVVILQIDGLPAPLLRWTVQAGDLPTLSRWLRTGTHRFVPWRAQLPATTPASQAGILHGRSEAVPAFRWYEKESSRLVVTNHPKDAAYVEKGMSDGRGLLADGGVSIGNIFSGDAVHSLLTISAGRGHGPTRAFTSSYLRPLGFARSLVLTLGEMVKEVHQGRRQQARGVEPRINRMSSYVALRGVTNVLLRDLNVRLLAEQMLTGTPVMYADFTDYDEVAHHAGPIRPESLASLVGVDRAIAVLEKVAAVAPRQYELVVLSDHGQSQGATFRQRFGYGIDDLVRRLIAAARPGSAATTLSGTGKDEQWGPVGALLTEVGAGEGVFARVSRHVVRRREADPPGDADRDEIEVVVTSSGNLAFVYLVRHPGRLTREDLDRLHPGLIEDLAHHEGVGFVAVRSKACGLIVVGPAGVHYLDELRVEGVDPLEPFGPEAADELRRHGALAHVGDIVINSCIDATTGEVAAFEELVGSHGGLGGWQSEAVLVHPAGWSEPGPLMGADAVHRQLIRWLGELGLRARVGSSAADDAAVEPARDGAGTAHRERQPT